MRFITFSFGEYERNQRDHTISSVKEAGHSCHWYEFADGEVNSCAEGRNKAIKKAIPLEDETFCIMDRDVFIMDMPEESVHLPFGVIGVTGRKYNVLLSGDRVSGEMREDMYQVGKYVNPSKAISSILFMTGRTYRYIGPWDEDYRYSDDFWGFEDSEWIVRARMKGCEFVRLEGIEFGHFDHWIDESTDLLRRLDNSRRLFKHKYGFEWGRYIEAQNNVESFKKEKGLA